jgi:hypothetical protein
MLWRLAWRRPVHFVAVARASISLSGLALYRSLHACGEDEEEVHRRAAYWLEVLWSTNQTVIDRLYPLFTMSVGALALELVLWAVALRGIL